ncbi:MAG TPA: radical SAM family heme chaperone HemW [Nitrospirota bacterium]|nr:radical SAM family heme chaperone HemW [Nitrospirota bacterium]
MLSLYLHIPFCVRKCLYCGFYSTSYSPQQAFAYVSALQLEAARYKGNFSKAVFDSVYIGGGTPTVLSREQWVSIFKIVRENFRLSEDAEFTVEANPNTVAVDSIAFLRAHGVNRLSIGVQSFSDRVLKTLGRAHTAAQAEEAFKTARNAGLENIGIDLIYGVPGQSHDEWTSSVHRALTLEPEHISSYCLSLDEGSQFMREAEAGRLALPDDDVAARMYEFALRALTGAGYRHYEISNFSLSGYECLHNMNYWERGEYLGLGPGASSFISGKRYHAVADIHEYTRRLTAGLSIVEDVETVKNGPAAEETIMLGLRTDKGIDLRKYEQEFGPEASRYLEACIDTLRDSGLVRVRDGRLMLTDRGVLLSDEALARLFP